MKYLIVSTVNESYIEPEIFIAQDKSEAVNMMYEKLKIEKDSSDLVVITETDTRIEYDYNQDATSEVYEDNGAIEIKEVEDKPCLIVVTPQVNESAVETFDTIEQAKIVMKALMIKYKCPEDDKQEWIEDGSPSEFSFDGEIDNEAHFIYLIIK